MNRATRFASVPVRPVRRLRRRTSADDREDAVGADEVERDRSRDLRRTVAVGVQAGLVATAIMTAFRAPISQSLPPTAEFWAKYVGGGDPDDHRVAAVVLHLLYGAAAGAAYVVAVPGTTGESDYHAERLGAALGVAYGLVLSAFGKRVLLDRLLDMDLEADEAFVFDLSHVVYGLTLGTWVGSRES